MPARPLLSRLSLLLTAASPILWAGLSAAAETPPPAVIVDPAAASQAALPTARAPVRRPVRPSTAAEAAAAGTNALTVATSAAVAAAVGEPTAAGAAPGTVATTTAGEAATARAARRPIAPDGPFTGADIEAATYNGGDLPSGRSPITAKVQVLLDRSGISPGVTDGFKGGMSESAIKALERKLGLPVDGVMDPEVWAQLQTYLTASPLTQTYTITDADAADLMSEIPTDYAEKAKLDRLGYTSMAEKLGERFHMDDKFIGFLNPGVELIPGKTITVVTPAKPLKGQVTRIIVEKAAGRVAAYDAAGRLVVDYPATVGSTATPSPSGKHLVEGVAINPDYTYDPSKNFKQGNNDKVLRIPPGPNGPVGSVWIDLDKPTYGIHGTPTPSRLFRNESHGCVRLTNWDAEELAHMVRSNVTTVEFLDSGVSIADVTDPVAPPAPAAAAGTAAVVADPAGTVAAPTAAQTDPTASPVAPAADAVTPVPAGGADPLAAAIEAATQGGADVQQPAQDAVVLPVPSTPQKQ